MREGMNGLKMQHKTHPNRCLVMRIVVEGNVPCFARHDVEQISLREVPITIVGRAAN
jgi:hypothetical protein